MSELPTLPGIDDILDWFTNATLGWNHPNRSALIEYLLNHKQCLEQERAVQEIAKSHHRRELIEMLRQLDPEGWERAQYETYCAEHDLMPETPDLSKKGDQ